MKLSDNFLIVILLLIFSKIPLQAQNINQLIDAFIKINEVHSERINFGQKSVIYQNYERLSQIASTEELVKLTKHPHPVVQTYAGWALLDKS